MRKDDGSIQDRRVPPASKADAAKVQGGPATARMTAYYLLLTGEVSRLTENTAETRRAFYERARIVLMSQLQGRDSPISQADAESERRAFENAVAKVEAEVIERRDEAPRSILPERFHDAPGIQVVAVPPLKAVLDQKLKLALSAASPPAAARGERTDSDHAGLAAPITRQAGEVHSRLQAMIQAARYHGVELDRERIQAVTRGV